MSTLAIGAEVRPSDYAGYDPESAYRGRVLDPSGVDHYGESCPDEGMVLVRWSRTAVRWEYVEDVTAIR